MKTEIQFAILKTLSYFQVFKYPLTCTEIWRYLPLKCTQPGFDDALDDLTGSGTIFKIENYYCLLNDTTLVYRRKEGNKLGKKKLRKAILISRFLGAFPFVEGVFISGSLSKDFALECSDLDYFIVTAPNRLWTARNIMHAFRKLTFLFGAENSFCMNYYLSLYNPEIAPKNYYTAIELATLKTAYAHTGINNMICENNFWVSDLLPNCCLTNNLLQLESKKSLPACLLEYLINKLGGNEIESFFFNTTKERWRRKWSKKGYDIEQCMVSVDPHFSTPVNYPLHLPDKILITHEQIFREAIKRLTTETAIAHHDELAK